MFDAFVRSHLLSFLLFGGLFNALHIDVEASPAPSATLLLQANEFFDATLYNEAISLYQQILTKPPYDLIIDPQMSADELNKTRTHLTQAYLLTENFSEVIALLKNQPTLSNEQRYFLSLAYNRVGEHDLALEVLKLFSFQTNSAARFQQEALFERGFAHFSKENFQEASEVFKALNQTPHPSRTSYLAALYLVRLELLQENYAEAEHFLALLAKELPQEDLLRYELAYLQGETHFQMKDYLQAATYFEKALPQKNPQKASWYSETLYHLGWSYLKIGDDPQKDPTTQKQFFEKAELTLNALRAFACDERVILALGQFYLCRAKHLKEESAYKEAEQLLSKPEYFVSLEGKAHALLLRAEAASSYAIRNALYRNLTEECHQESSFFAKGWYLHGLNDFQEGQHLLAEKRLDEASKAFGRAASSLKKASELLLTSDKSLAGLAIKYQAQAYSYQNTLESHHQSLNLFTHLLYEEPLLLQAIPNPDEVFYLTALEAIHLSEENNEEHPVEKTLKLALQTYPQGKFADALLNLLATFYYKQGQFSAAELHFARLAKEHPHSLLLGEALLGAAKSAEQISGETFKSKAYRKELFENYPFSPQAAEAYFLYYSYEEYLHGDRIPLKHLQALPEKYPDTPFALVAFYLMGLDLKRDRKTPEGKWISKKNLNAAIDSFQAVDSAFDLLYQKGGLADNERAYFTSLRYRATLERALANLAIADESQGAKRQIFLEYAEDVFRNMLEDFKNQPHVQIKACASLHEECSYWLAQAYLKGDKDEAAENIFNAMLEKARNEKITRGYFLSRAWYEKGLIAMRQGQPAIALQALAQSEDASKGKVLSTDQKLDLWIQQSEAYRALCQYEKALLVLSKAVNDDAISGLRLKAMFLRAEIYELQGREELARKQLLSVSKKGGIWAIKSKEKLDQTYEY